MESHIKLLLVEDEVIHALLIKEQFKENGIVIRKHVTTGKEAIESAIKDSPDFILMDIRLTDDISGIEAAKEIKKASDIPIIFITGYVDDETREKALALNPLALFTKPIEVESIIELIKNV